LYFESLKEEVEQELDDFPIILDQEIVSSAPKVQALPPTTIILNPVEKFTDKEFKES